jgi:hypothetical protein
MALDFPDENGIWIIIKGKYVAEDHIIDQHISQLSHVGETPVGYSDLGQEVGYTGDSTMVDVIFRGQSCP